MIKPMRSNDDPIRKFVELRQLGHELDRAGWPSREIARQRLDEFLRGERPGISDKTLRGAFTYANEAGDSAIVLEAARKLGTERVFQDSFMFGQVAVARIRAGLESIAAWEAYLEGL
jgi:hypothetical protein